MILLKVFSSRRLLREFPQKSWNKNGLDVLLCRRSEAAVNLCLGGFQTQHHWQGHWSLITGSQVWGHVFMHFEQLINWNNCLSVERFCFTRTPFVWISNSKANIHIVPFQFVKYSYFKFMQGSVATLFMWSWKIFYLTNISKTLRINFYQNRSSTVKVVTKKLWCVFMPHSVY